MSLQRRPPLALPLQEGQLVALLLRELLQLVLLLQERLPLALLVLQPPSHQSQKASLLKFLETDEAVTTGVTLFQHLFYRRFGHEVLNLLIIEHFCKLFF